VQFISVAECKLHKVYQRISILSICRCIDRCSARERPPVGGVQGLGALRGDVPRNITRLRRAVRPPKWQAA
jgi:hypothetical protein